VVLGTKDGAMLKNRYKPVGNPTVVYYQGPEKYKERLEKILRGENTFVSLVEDYEKDPDNVELAFELARKYTEKGARDEAKKIYQRIVDKNADVARFTTVPYYEDHQVNALEYAKYNLAIGIFQTNDTQPLLDFIIEYPDGELTENACMSLGNYFMYMGSEEDADRFFQIVLDKYDTSPMLLTEYLRYCLRVKKNLDQAREIADKIISMTNVVFDNPYYNRASVAALTADSTKLMDLYGDQYLKSRKSRWAYELDRYANFWITRKENSESAEAAICLELSIDPDNIYRRYAVARNFINLGKLEEAENVFGPEAIKPYLDNPSTAIYFISFWTDQGKHLDDALALARKEVEKNSADLGAAENLALVLLKMGKTQEAVEAYGPKLIADYWDDHATLNSYAWFWAEQGENLKHALKASLHSLELAPNDHYYMDTAALIYWKQGNLKKAIEYQKKALEINPGNAEYQKRLKEMEAELKK